MRVLTLALLFIFSSCGNETGENRFGVGTEFVLPEVKYLSARELDDLRRVCTALEFNKNAHNDTTKIFAYKTARKECHETTNIEDDPGKKVNVTLYRDIPTGVRYFKLYEPTETSVYFRDFITHEDGFFKLPCDELKKTTTVNPETGIIEPITTLQVPNWYGLTKNNSSIIRFLFNTCSTSTGREYRCVGIQESIKQTQTNNYLTVRYHEFTIDVLENSSEQGMVKVRYQEESCTDPNQKLQTRSNFVQFGHLK